MTDFDPAETSQRRADIADAVTAQTKRLMERRTTTLRERAERAEGRITDALAVIREWQRDGESNDYLTRVHRALWPPVGFEGTSTERETTARVFAALHQSAEQDVSRVIALYEQWVKAGAPPLGTSMARWWDARLVELRAAVDDSSPATPNLVHADPNQQVSEPDEVDEQPACTCTYGQRCPNCRD